MEKDFKCKICDVEFSSQNLLIRHIKKIHPQMESYEAYILKYFFDGIRPTCKCGCGTEMQFFSFEPNFFNDYAKNHFPRKLHSDETKIRIGESSKRTFIERYGVDNAMKVPEFVDKIRSTKKEIYDDETHNNVPKQRETILKRYGSPNYHNTEKMFETNLRLYGAKMFVHTPEGKLKVKQTKKDHFGDENYTNVEKIRQTKKEKYGYECEFENPLWKSVHNSKISKIQSKVATDLQSGPFKFGGYEFDIKVGRFLIEVDGEAYHPTNMHHMTLTQLGNIQNDYKKTVLVSTTDDFDLLRVGASDMKKIDRCISFEDIWEMSYEQDYSFDYYTKFVTRECLSRYIDKKGKDNLFKYWRVFYRFIQKFQPEFPTILTNEDLSGVVRYISNYNLDKVRKNEVFNNNCSVVGSSYLKSKFKSYWNSSYNGVKSPAAAWSDDKIMSNVIKYRIGLNDSNEVFDFSLHQLIRGLSAKRITISFFKPILAASIYKHFIGDVECPIVFDPCAGFGGRMLGFKSIYPNGTYIACEPNIETFNELLELSGNFTKVQIYNCKIEDFDLNLLPSSVDLSFTSIPYFDLETYSNPVMYQDIDHWKSIFIERIKLLPNLLINVPMTLRTCFDGDCEEYFISSSTSHFNKKDNLKFEYLLSFVNDKLTLAK